MDANPFARRRFASLIQFGRFLGIMLLAAAVMVVGGYVAMWFARAGVPEVGMGFGLIALFASVALVNVAGEQW